MKKHIRLYISLIIFELIACIYVACVKVYVQDRNNKDYYATYTKYNLSIYELSGLANTFDIVIPDAVGGKNFCERTIYNRDKADYTIEAGPMTEQILYSFSEMIIKNDKEFATQYGITEENPLTMEWILTHYDLADYLLYKEHEGKLRNYEEVLDIKYGETLERNKNMY